MTTISGPVDQVASVILITGNMAAGKSTVAQGVAERLPKSAHLRGDVFRRMIVRGCAEMTAELGPEAYAQLRLRYRIAAAAANLYVQAGFTVVYQDIIIGPDLLDVLEYYRQHPLYVVVLCPSASVVATRDAERGKTGYRNEAEVAVFDRVLRSDTPRLGLWLDTTELSVAQTVDQIFLQLPQAQIHA